MGSGRRVVVTGMGVVTGIGDDVPRFWSSLAAGRSAIRRWRCSDPRIESRIGGDLSDFSLDEHLARVGAGYPERLTASARRLLRTTPLPGRMVAAAALQAWADAGLTDRAPAPERLGHVCAGHNLAWDYLAENQRAVQDDPEGIEPLFGVLGLDTDVVGATCDLLDLRGPSFLVGAACASGGLAIVSALDLVRSGRADAVLVTGAPLVPDALILQAWTMIDAISVRSFNDEPERASRPFDALREGFVPSEGAGALVLESADGARRRGACVRAEVLGGASTSDANRLTRPGLDGQRRAMRSALRDAGLAPSAVDYVNAHATSTPQGDAVEVAAIRSVLGDRAGLVPVNATKSMTGHCLTAAGVVEAIATVLQIQHGVVHPTINQEERDPDLDLDFVPNRAREHRIRVGISNSAGFGGLNSCVVLGAPEDM